MSEIFNLLSEIFYLQNNDLLFMKSNDLTDSLKNWGTSGGKKAYLHFHMTSNATFMSKYGYFRYFAILFSLAKHSVLANILQSNELFK